MAEEIGTIKIEEIEFTLFYDYDQLRDKKLGRLSDDGKIKWFQLRMEMVFLEPLRRIFNRQSVVHRELNSSPESEWPRTAFMTAAFSALLNGIEALGSFIPMDKTIYGEHYKKSGTNYFNFRGFIKEYMKPWDVQINGTYYKDKRGNSFKSVYLPLVLWDYFRNGMAHAFVVDGGGIDYKADLTRWVVEQNGYLEIGPVRFFDDFQKGVDNFFDDAKSKHRTNFLPRFKETYPNW